MPELPKPPILGLGNGLLGGDGLGAAEVAERECNYETALWVRVADGGTLGLALLGLFVEWAHVILVDAVRVDAPPGIFVRVDGDEVAPAGARAPVSSPGWGCRSF